MQKVYWLEPDRFEEKPNKSPWLEMAKALNRTGFEVRIVTGGTGEKTGTESKGVDIKYLWALNLPVLFRPSLILSMLVWLLKTSRKEDIVILKPDCLFIAPLLKIAGRNNLHLDVRTVPVEINTLKNRFDRWLFWTVAVGNFRKYVNGWSFITERLKDSVEDEFDAKFNSYVIWQSGVNSDLFSQACERGDDKDTGDYIVLYHGSLTRKRGIDRVVRSLALLKGKYKDYVKLVIIGAGPDLPRLKSIAENIGVSEQISFKGLMAYEKMPSEVAKADIGIYPLPNLPEWDVSSPIKVFEYMASSKPMILTPINAHTDVLSCKDFVVWANGYDDEDFRDAIMYSFDHREVLEKNAQSAPQIVRSLYDWSIQGSKLADYLKQQFGR